MEFEGRKSLLKISLSLSLSLFAGRHQTNTPAPRTNPLSTTPTLSASAIDSHTPIPHYTQAHTKHINAHTLTHARTHTVPFLITHTENRAVRDRGEGAGAVLWCNGRKCWCFIWNWWSLVSAALPGAGPLCAGCVNERSNRDWTGVAESQSIELLESHTKLLRDTTYSFRSRRGLFHKTKCLYW